MISLHPLFQAIATAPSETELRLRFMDGVSDYFGVQRWGIYLLDSQQRLATVDVVGVSDNFVERYEKFGKTVDPLLQYVLENHAPTHEEIVLPQGTWKLSELYQRCCSDYDHEHIMTGPIVGEGNLIGTVHFARVGNNTPAFSSHDLVRLGAVCTHFSARLTGLRQHQSPTKPLSSLGQSFILLLLLLEHIAIFWGKINSSFVLVKCSDRSVGDK